MVKLGQITRLDASKRQRKAHRSRRTRRSRFEELLQLDGSIHAWVAGIATKQCLMNLIDDATGKTLALLDTGETTDAAIPLNGTSCGKGYRVLT